MPRIIDGTGEVWDFCRECMKQLPDEDEARAEFGSGVDGEGKNRFHYFAPHDSYGDRRPACDGCLVGLSAADD